MDFIIISIFHVLDPLGEERGRRPWSLTPEYYGSALKELFDLWYKDIMEGHPVSIREFDNWLAMLQGNPPEACAQMGRCSMQNIVEANGDIFPCDFYVLDQYRAGNIQDEDFPFWPGRFFRNRFSQRRAEKGAGNVLTVIGIRCAEEAAEEIIQRKEGIISCRGLSGIFPLCY